jgi:hypothetical protein
MASKFGTWRQKIKQHPFVTMGIIALLVAFLAFVLAVLWLGWDWTGFTRYIGPELRLNQQYRPEKTLWDWLQLLVIPLMFAIGGFWFNQLQKSREPSMNEQKEKIEKQNNELRLSERPQSNVARLNMRLQRITNEK